jgi:hypothetical protein
MDAINCKELCANGCILGDKCPHLEYLAKARKFIEETSIESIIQIAASRFDPPTPEPIEPDSEVEDS